MTRDQHVRSLLGWPAPATTTSLSAHATDSVRPSDTTPHFVRISGGFAQFAQKLRPTSFLRFVFLAAFVLLGCDRTQGTVLWHAYNGAERDALTATVARWNTEHPDQPLEVIAVPYGAFADKITSAIPGGNGPDLFIYPQDRIGDWADSGVIEPIEFWVDDARADRFTREAIESMAYKGSLWGMPMTVKSLALFYRTDLVAAPPATTDALIALGPTMRARDGYAVAYANVDLYGHAPWLFGFGGRILDDDGKLAL